ncbi:hypothetical protein [Ruegeria sp. Ofav3-42]|uniref:hypothetical protein n=1 Tax=Ruegeria sp. Ofav3-42 TaxID=2917759 RepID=UPI001EF6EB35|nr:hypothetical protein [Ruegeria sp. Ofav3-42]MCG7520605.1 hypothetical protein [Ruegeria sp. Ofav3-42]
MSEKTLANQKNPFVAWWVRIVLLVYLVLSASHIILNFFSVQYFPSPDWLIKARPFDIALCVAVLCFISVVCFRLWMNQNSRSAKPHVFWQWFNFSIFPVWFVLFGGAGPVTYGFPIIVSTFAGEEIELPYTSDWYGGSGPDGRCPYSVELEGVPSPWDRLCNLSEELATTIKPGETILVSGTGTRMGLFAYGAELPTDR